MLDMYDIPKNNDSITFNIDVAVSEAAPFSVLPLSATSAPFADLYKTSAIKAQIKSSISEALRESNYSIGERSELSEVINEYIETKYSETIDAIVEIALAKADDYNALANLLFAIGRIESRFASPTLGYIVSSHFSYTNSEEIIELSIRAFENWENKEFIPHLAQCHLAVNWLEEYKNNVIKALKDL